MPSVPLHLDINGSRRAAPRVFRVTREPVRDGTSLVLIDGELDLAAADHARDALMGSIRDGATTLVVDLSECAFIDSSGLGVLLEAKSALDGEAGGRVLLAAPASQPRRVLDVTSIDTVVPVFDTRDEAVQAAAAPH